MKQDRIMEILRQAKTLAQEYRVLTGRPLGITGEVAEHEAPRLLGIELTPARLPDTTRLSERAGERVDCK